MNNNTTTIRRTFTAAIAATAFFAVTACGSEVSPPSQNIGASHSKPEKKAPPQPPRTSDRRMDFGDETGTADHHETKPSPAGRGTRNRMDFRDNGF